MSVPDLRNGDPETCDGPERHARCAYHRQPSTAPSCTRPHRPGAPMTRIVKSAAIAIALGFIASQLILRSLRR